MLRLHHIVACAGWLLLMAGILLIAAGWIGVVMRDGFGALMEMLSPYNVINFAVTAATLLPGYLLINLAGRMKQRREIEKSASDQAPP